MIDVPPAVRAKAYAHGAHGWLDELPSLLAELSTEWSITVGPVYPDASEALVAEAVCADGAPAVLKLVVPRCGVGDRDAARDEITVLRLVGGQGCARLLRADERRSALLIERLGPSLHDLGVPLPRQHEILVEAASRVWRPASDAGLPSGAEGAVARRLHHRDVGPAAPPVHRTRGGARTVVCGQTHRRPRRRAGRARPR